MRDQIMQILKDCPPELVRVNQVGTLWQVSLERHSDAGEDGEAVARGLLALWQWDRAQEAPVQVGHTDEPEDLKIPRFLEPDPLEGVPDTLRALAEPGETIAGMKSRFWRLFVDLQSKIADNGKTFEPATREEHDLHSKLHGYLYWFMPPLEGED